MDPHKNNANKLTLLAIALGTIFWMADTQAAATLSPTATTAGFALTTFVDTIPNVGAVVVGPAGMVNITSGNILIANYVTGEIRNFSDVDHRTWFDGIAASTNYGVFNAIGLTSVGGNYYLSEQASGAVVQIDAQGNFVQNIAPIGFATGIAGDANTGNLFVTGAAGIFELDPSAHSASLFQNIPADGLSISPDGSTLYAANVSTGHVLGFNIATGAQSFDSGFIPGGVDGIALGTGSLEGNIFINTNSGTLSEVDLSSLASTLIFSGGSRGDFVSVDTNNGTLLITQTDQVLRLTAPTGGGFGAQVPLPGAVWLFGSGLIGLLSATRKRKSV